MENSTDESFHENQPQDGMTVKSLLSRCCRGQISHAECTEKLDLIISFDNLLDEMRAMMDEHEITIQGIAPFLNYLLQEEKIPLHGVANLLREGEKMKWIMFHGYLVSRIRIFDEQMIRKNTNILGGRVLTNGMSPEDFWNEVKKCYQAEQINVETFLGLMLQMKILKQRPERKCLEKIKKLRKDGLLNEKSTAIWIARIKE